MSDAPDLCFCHCLRTDLRFCPSSLQTELIVCSFRQHSCEAFDDDTGISTRVSMLRMDASSMSWRRFAGSCLSSQGTYDVFTDQWRQLNEALQQPTNGQLRRYQLLVLDGHCPAIWIENILATTKVTASHAHRGATAEDSARVSRTESAASELAGRTLSSEPSTSRDESSVKLILEGTSLRDANPCWATFAFVHVQDGCVGPDVIIHRWLQSHPHLYQKQIAKQLGIFFPR